VSPISRRNFLQAAAGATAGLYLSAGARLFGATNGLSSTYTEAGIEKLPQGTPFAGPIDPPNSPIGTARGVFPGRVTFARDSRVSLWDGIKGRWWDEGNIDEKALEEMFSKALKGLVGAETDAGAWEKLFISFNTRHGRGARTYHPGEIIAVKLNFNNTSSYTQADNAIDTSPQATRALLKQMTGPGGVAMKNIVLYDAMRVIPDRVYNPIHAEFPEVRWVDAKGLNGREGPEWMQGAITYSSRETEIGKELPKAVVESAYLINFALLKGHEMSGVTLCGKNHFGSIRYPFKDHPKYVTPMNRPADAYSAYVDLMGSPNLGGKTLLYIVDGLYGMSTNVGAPLPQRDQFRRLFNGEWSSCYFMSQDAVAIDSVCLDFLTSEFPEHLGFSGNKNYPLGAIHHCDNYLHEAALGTNQQLGPYKPNGLVIGSQGVHEHWNNAKDRQYSRNLSKDGNGIELLTV
jgi:hypothetical protein